MIIRLATIIMGVDHSQMPCETSHQIWQVPGEERMAGIQTGAHINSHGNVAFAYESRRHSTRVKYPSSSYWMFKSPWCACRIASAMWCGR